MRTTVGMAAGMAVGITPGSGGQEGSGWEEGRWEEGGQEQEEGREGGGGLGPVRDILSYAIKWFFGIFQNCVILSGTTTRTEY